ncbi:MAG: TatD family hydrolase [Bacteroidota bacterium]|nr:TatD family hydrolase [Bacteroidota bacterium]
MYFIDTHSHLYLKQFNKDREQVVHNAINAGIKNILLPNIDRSTTADMKSLCALFPENCFPMMGLHPCSVKKETLEMELKHVDSELNKDKYIAVGEIGIDLHWKKSTLDIQKKAFAYQIELAKKLDLPIVIHVRNSFNEAIEIVKNMNDSKLSGVFHCFSGNVEDAQRIINLDRFYLGIGGVVTFKNSGLADTIKNIDLQHIILETDSPYLSPSPFRGDRNESKYIIEIAKKICDVKNITLEELADITSKNANSLFKLDSSK